MVRSRDPVLAGSVRLEDDVPAGLPATRVAAVRGRGERSGPGRVFASHPLGGRCIIGASAAGRPGAGARRLTAPPQREELMTHTYESLHKQTIEHLREIAKGLDHEAVKGYTQMNKEHLLPALCQALGIDTHAHHVTVGVDKKAIKAEIRKLKAERDEALSRRDHAALHVIRRKIHSQIRKIRKATV